MKLPFRHQDISGSVFFNQLTGKSKLHLDSHQAKQEGNDWTLADGRVITLSKELYFFPMLLVNNKEKIHLITFSKSEWFFILLPGAIFFLLGVIPALMSFIGINLNLAIFLSQRLSKAVKIVLSILVLLICLVMTSLLGFGLNVLTSAPATQLSDNAVPVITSQPITFTSEKDSFSVTFPNQPTEETSEVNTWGIVTVPMTTYSTDAADGTTYNSYSVTVSTLPEIILSNSSSSERVKWGSEGLVDDTTKVIESKPITFQTLQAIENRLYDEKDQLYIQTINFEKGKKTYLLIKISNQDPDTSDRAFFDSFQLL